jgi:DHA1 family solute carrier family 18 vesicular amine transporter 1/2
VGSNYVLVVCTIIAQALTDMSFGFVAPFLPVYANDRGATHAAVGAIFATQQIVSLVTTPMSPCLTRWLGSRFVLMVSLAGQGIVALLWLVAGRIPRADTAPFVILCFVLRGCQGAVQGVFEGASTSLLMKSVTEDMVGSVVGWSEAGRAIGFMMGPPIGGLLYHVGGFDAPFLTGAAAMFLSPIVLGIVMLRSHRVNSTLPESQETSTRSNAGGEASAIATDGTKPSLSTGAGAAGYCTLLRTPAVLAGMLVNFTVAADINSFNPTLEPFLKDLLSLGPTSVGLLLATAVVGYIIFSILSGMLAKKCCGDLIVLLTGLLLSASGLLLTGPSPLLSKAIPALPKKSISLIAISFGMIGSGLGLTTAPTMNLMVRAVSKRGQSVASAANELGALATFAFSCGATFGPLYSGVAISKFGHSTAICVQGRPTCRGFQWFATSMGFFNATTAFIVFTPMLLVGKATGASRGALLAPLVDSDSAAAVSNADVLGPVGVDPTSRVERTTPRVN